MSFSPPVLITQIFSLTLTSLNKVAQSLNGKKDCNYRNFDSSTQFTANRHGRDIEANAKHKRIKHVNFPLMLISCNNLEIFWLFFETHLKFRLVQN